MQGLLSSMLFVGMMIGAIMFGNSADKHGRRATLMVGMTINGFFGALSSFAHSFSFFLICRLLSGIGYVLLLDKSDLYS
jgi:MFS transporter, VNT family, synaptic vesicle glycoprotein 2